MSDYDFDQSWGSWNKPKVKKEPCKHEFIGTGVPGSKSWWCKKCDIDLAKFEAQQNGVFDDAIDLDDMEEII